MKSEEPNVLNYLKRANPDSLWYPFKTKNKSILSSQQFLGVKQAIDRQWILQSFTSSKITYIHSN